MATGGEQQSTRHVKDDDSIGGKLPAMCDPCGRRKKTTPATVMCSTCDVKLCRGCREGHQVHVPGKHVFVAVDDVAMETVLVDMQGLDLCSAHNREFRYICKDHESLCCDECHFDHHRTCTDIHKLKDMATVHADSSLVGSVEKVHKVISSATEVINSCEMQVQSSKERRNEIINEIDSKKEEMMKGFDDAKRRILEDLDEHMDSDKARLEDVKHGAESVQTNLQSLMTLNEAVSKDGTDIEKFVLDLTCKQRAAMVTAKLTELQDKNNYTVKHTLEWNAHLLTAMNEQLVSLRHTQLPSAMDTPDDNDHVGASEPIEEEVQDPQSLVTDPPSEQATCAVTATEPIVEEVQDSRPLVPDQPSAHTTYAVTDTEPIKEAVPDPQPRVTDQPSAQVTPSPAKLTLVKTLDLVKTEGDEKEPWVTGLAFLADDRIAAVDYMNNTCFILNADLQRLGSAYKLQHTPHDVTCYQESKLAVTLRCSIALLSVAEDNVITLQKTLPTSFYCGSISPLDTDTFVVSTTGNKPPVRTIDVHGNKGEIKHKLLPDKTYSNIWDIACAYIPSTKTLVVTDRDQHTVYMCDLTSGEGHAIKNYKMRGPRGVCAGPAGTVFVCSEGTRSVVQLSPQGDVLASHRVDVRLPHVVSVFKDSTRLILSNFSGRKMIKLFSIV